jgi:glycosyltransferase involved in cell wall biosynthesis
MISVIIPTYNRSALILRSVQSVLRQSYSDLELIVVDDNSTDDTLEVLAGICDRRLKVFSLPRTGGACHARNYGVTQAQGEYIAFNDSDDEWMTLKLVRQMEYLLQNKFDVVGCQMLVAGNGKEVVFPAKPHFSADQIHRRNYISTQTILGKKKCFVEEPFDDDLPRFQDWDLVIRLSNRYRVGIVPEVLVNTFIQRDSISLSYDKAIYALSVFLRRHANSPELKSHYFWHRAKYSLLAGRDPIPDYLKAFRYAPLKPRNIVAVVASYLRLSGVLKRLYESRA